jgi:hypothetical protein
MRLISGILGLWVVISLTVEQRLAAVAPPLRLALLGVYIGICALTMLALWLHLQGSPADGPADPPQD